MPAISPNGIAITQSRIPSSVMIRTICSGVAPIDCKTP